MKGSSQLPEKRSLNDEERFQLDDPKAGKVTPQQGWLKDVWGKWSGDEPIEDLLAALKND